MATFLALRNIHRGCVTTLNLPLLTLLLGLFFITACAPKPDPHIDEELARVYGECSFQLNTASLDIAPLPANDPRQQIVAQIVNELVNSRHTHFPWTIHTTLFNTPDANAFTTGGGFLAVFSGVFAMAPDEAGLAGILAHELAHMSKFDPMEFAGYLEELLAYRLQQSGIEGEYEKGLALQTLTDFCTSIPGLVSRSWQQDLLPAKINEDLDATFSDSAVPYIPYTFSTTPESDYSPLIRDPDGIGRSSACDRMDREVDAVSVMINPEYYRQTFPDRASLPPIPDYVGDGVSAIPVSKWLWQAEPWLQFQFTALMRYAECQSDEVALLNLLASHYNPLALGESFESFINLLNLDESTLDWRFLNHPSLNQRIEDMTWFLNNNGDVLPNANKLNANGHDYQRYKIFTDRESDYLALHETAKDELLAYYGIDAGTTETDAVAPAKFDPINIMDVAMLLLQNLDQTDAVSTSSSAAPKSRCDIYNQVYKAVTGKENQWCFSTLE